MSESGITFAKDAAADGREGFYNEGSAMRGMVRSVPGRVPVTGTGMQNATPCLGKQGASCFPAPLKGSGGELLSSRRGPRTSGSSRTPSQAPRSRRLLHKIESKMGKLDFFFAGNCVADQPRLGL